MTKFYLCCPWCHEVSAHPLYEEYEAGGEFLWNTRKNTEFLQKHGTGSECGIDGIQFIREEDKVFNLKNGFKAQEDVKDYKWTK